jgi:hypothetical protein
MINTDAFFVNLINKINHKNQEKNIISVAEINEKIKMKFIPLIRSLLID